MKRFLPFSLLLLGLAGCTTMDAVTGMQTANMYSIQQDVELGAQAYSGTIEQMRARGIPVNTDRRRVEQLQEMVRRIGAVSHMPQLPYEVCLIETNVVNAMAAPGGKIMVYEGLWDPEEGLAQDDDEIAAVIAHEIAHVNARHSTEAMTRALPGNLLATGVLIATKDSENKEFWQTLAAAGMFVHNGMFLTRYSRENELEADSVGLMYMARAGYDPRAAIRIWERADQARTGRDPAASIFSTHPPSAQRLVSLRAQLPAAMAIYQSR
jgi:predicted Zn-dependent protease